MSRNPSSWPRPAQLSVEGVLHDVGLVRQVADARPAGLRLPGLPAGGPRRGAGEAARRLDIPAKRWRAKDVAGLRDGLLASWRSGRLMKTLLAHPLSGMRLPVHEYDVEAGVVTHWSRGQWHDFLIERLPDADLFYVTADMTDLVVNAAAAAPAYQVFADKLPAQTGFVVFEHPFCVVEPEALDPGQRVELVGAFWTPVPDVGGAAAPVPGVMVVTVQDSGVLWWTQSVADVAASAAQMRAFFTEQVAESGPLAYHDEWPMPFGDAPWGMEPGTGLRNNALAAVQTVWNLMNQRLTETREEPAPRHKVERAAKRGERPPPAVRVVDLAPRRKRIADPDRQQTRDGEPSRRYTRRWTVQGYGYWRDTWYPSKGRHEQQWVEVDTYVKGPEGAPFVPAKVQVLRER